MMRVPAPLQNVVLFVGQGVRCLPSEWRWTGVWIPLWDEIYAVSNGGSSNYTQLMPTKGDVPITLYKQLRCDA